MDPVPHLRRGRRLHLRDGRGRASARRRRRRHHDGRGRRHRERSWDYYQDGAPKVDEAVLADGLDAAKGWIRDAIDLQEELMAKVGTKDTMEYSTVADYSDEISERGEPPPGVSASRPPRPSPTRPSARPPRPRPSRHWLPSCPPGSPRSKTPIARSRRLSARSPRRSCARRIVEEGVRIDGRGPRRHPAALVRGRGAAHCPRLGPVPAGRDPGPQRHHPGHGPHGPDDRHDRSGHPQALHAPLQLPAVLHR